MVRAGSEERERVPSKTDSLKVEPGDRIIFITAGSGGWGDPLERPIEKVLRDVRDGLVSRQKAERDYGVLIGEDMTVDESGTEALRKSQRTERGEPAPFDFGFIPGVHEAAE